MKKIVLEEIEYELVKNYKDAFNLEEVKELYTDYFKDYDYIVGDIAYNKLRLKGFYDAKNKKVKSFNNFKSVDVYLNEFCSYDCKHFIIKKIA